MKKFIPLIITMAIQLTWLTGMAQGVAISNDDSSPDASAMLDVKSTTKGMLIPRMTTSERNAIGSPAEGLMVFDLTTGSFWFYSSGWQEMAGGSSNWLKSGNDLYYNSGNVGIGDQSPAAALTVGNGDKFQVDGTSGGILFTDPNASMTFPPVSGVSNPIITMFSSGTSNADRMVIAHSSGYPDWGLMYEDLSDEFHFVSSGTKRITFSPIGRIGINQENPTYNLDVDGTARIESGVYIYGILNLYNSMDMSGSLSVDGNITTDGNKGIVRTNTSTQYKVVKTTASFSATNMSSNTNLTSGSLSYESFGGTPTVIVGNLVSGTGEWYKVKLVPYSVGSSSCIFRLFNPASDALTFTGTWNIIVIGPE